MMSKEHQFYKEAMMGLLPDQDRIQKNVLAQVPIKRSSVKGHRWIIPVAACLMALIIVCATVPPVRAAISQWFSRNHSVQNYLAQPEEARPSTPELDTIIEQTMPEETQFKNSIEIAAIAPEWQEWADSLNPSVGDVFFDGKELMVSFDMGGGAKELVIGGEPYSIEFGNPQYIILNGEKYACFVCADVAESERLEYVSFGKEREKAEEEKKLLEEDANVYCAATVYFSKELTGPIFEKETSSNNQMGYIKEAQRFDPDYVPWDFKELKHQMRGVQQAELRIPLTMFDYSKTIKYEDGSSSNQGIIIGALKLRFSFDPEAGNESFRSFKINKTIALKGQGTYGWMDWDSQPDYVIFNNKTVDLSGVTMTGKRMDSYISGAELYVDISCPEDWGDTDRENFLRSLEADVIGDGVSLRISGSDWRNEKNDPGITIYLDMLPSELDSINTYEVLLKLNRFSKSVLSSDGKPIQNETFKF